MDNLNDTNTTTKDSYFHITLESFLNKQKIEKFLNIIICKLCNNIPLKPVKDVLGCGSYFCQSCLDQLWKRDESSKEIFKICPNNCDPFYFKDISGIELQQFKEILIKCKNYDNGCKMIYNYDFIDLLIEHEKECDYKQIMNISKDISNKTNISNIKFNSINSSPMKLNLSEVLYQFCLKCKQNYAENKEKHDCVTHLLKIIDNLQKNSSKDFKDVLKENFNLKAEIEFLKNKILKENNSMILPDSNNSEKDSSKNEIGDLMNSIYVGDKIPKAISRTNENLCKLSSKNYSTFDTENTFTKMLGFSSNKSNTNIRISGFDPKNKLKNSNSNFKEIRRTPSIKVNGLKEKIIQSSNKAINFPSKNVNVNNLFSVESNSCQFEKSKILKEVDYNILGEIMFKKRIEMIFRASENGFKAEKFHQFCDGKSPTIVLIKSNYGKIFGGYTKSKWSSNDNWVNDDSRSSFIFSVQHSTKHKLKHSKNAIFSGKSHGPIFGKGYDIYISNNCNLNTNSFCNLGNSYSLNNCSKSESIESKTYLAGNINFKITEYEVYQILDN